VVRLFFVLSGENSTLPFAEIKAILETEDIAYRDVRNFPQILSLDTSEKCVRPISIRSSMTKICAKEIFVCKASQDLIIQKMREELNQRYLENCNTFAVRIRRIQKSNSQINTKRLEEEIGRIILLRKNKDLRVKLIKPERTFIGVLSGKYFIFGCLISKIDLKSFSLREPNKRPFSHPSMMGSKLARCMVNLARPKLDCLFLDPFCGTGSLLLEAGLIGCKIIGSDLDPQMIEGCSKNLRHYGIKRDLIVADARRVPYNNIDCVATDPPYGRSSSTYGSSTRVVISDFLLEIVDILSKNAYVTISSPKCDNEIFENAGFQRIEKHFVYEHKSLTREITVLKKL
jgi:tRNA (guanine10-N2)-dimethyltransferase